MKPILARIAPHNLQELRLTNCFTVVPVVEELINFIVEEKVQLRSLSLVKMGLTKACIEEITTLISNSEYIEDLDLSWNDLLPSYFSSLFKVLARNRSLRYLNLSCNTLIDKADQNNKFDFGYVSAM